MKLERGRTVYEQFPQDDSLACRCRGASYLMLELGSDSMKSLPKDIQAVPVYFTRSGEGAEVWPSPDGEYEVVRA